MFADRTVLVTGGTGSWGYELIKRLLSMDPKEIIIFSRNESNQAAMKRAFADPRLRFRIGDIRDKDALIQAIEGADYVFHLAALKHVPVCEEQPLEALKTNVIGTQNVIEASIINKVKKVIYISTDKADNPSNFYGMTKAIGEKLVVYANLLGSATQFVCVRGGNVLGKSDSVVHMFKEQIREKNEIAISDKRITRLFHTFEDEIQLLMKASEQSLGGEIFVMTIPSCNILDLAEVIIDASGNKGVKINEIGVRPGEKKHEVILSEQESEQTVVYDDHCMVILPSIDIPGLKQAYAGYASAKQTKGIFEERLMTKDEIRLLLIKGGYLP